MKKLIITEPRLSQSDKVIPTDASFSEVQRTYLSIQFQALSNSLPIEAATDVVTATFLEIVQSLKVEEWNKANFYWGMAILVRQETAFPLGIFIEFSDIIVKIFKKYFAVTEPFNNLNLVLLKTYRTYDKGALFADWLLFHFLKLPLAPTQLLEWKVFFWGIFYFKEPIPIITFWINFQYYFTEKDIENLLPIVDKRPLNVLTKVLHNNQILSAEKRKVALYLTQEIESPFEYSSQLGNLIRVFLEEDYDYLCQKVDKINGIEDLKKIILIQFKFWMYCTNYKFAVIIYEKQVDTEIGCTTNSTNTQWQLSE